jgi:hypothetical protein
MTSDSQYWGRAMGTRRSSLTLPEVVTQKVHSKEERKGKSCIPCGGGLEYLHRSPASRR